MRLGLRGVELSQLSNGVYAVAGYALVAELSSHEVSKLSMVVCTSEISVDLTAHEFSFHNQLFPCPCSASYPSGNLVDGSPLVANSYRKSCTAKG